MTKTRVLFLGIGLITIFIIGLVGCEQYKSKAPTGPVDPLAVLNFWQHGVPEGANFAQDCPSGYGVCLIHGEPPPPEPGKPGQITLVLPPGNYTINYDMENAPGQTKDVTVTGDDDMRVFIGTEAIHGNIDNVTIIDKDTGDVIYYAVVNGVVQSPVCDLSLITYVNYCRLPQPEPEPIIETSSAVAPAKSK